MPTLSLCMIVKNEEENLPLCLDSIREFVDEIIIVDTGSTDNTKKIAERYGSKIFEFEWIGDFSAARNFALDKATSDYILILDPDEFIAENELKKLPQILSTGKKIVQVNVSDYNGEMVLPSVRLFQNIGLKYKRIIHEKLDLGEDTTEDDFFRSDLNICHRPPGNIDPAQKIRRNLKLCLEQLKTDPDDAEILYWTAYDYKRLGNFTEAINYYQKAVEADIDRSIPQAARDLALLLDRPGNEKQFELVLNGAMVLYPNFLDLAMIKARVYLRNGDINEAIMLFQKCVDGPHSEGWLALNTELAWQGLGTAYYLANNNDLALHSVTKALEINDHNPETLTMLLSILIDKKGLAEGMTEAYKFTGKDNVVLSDMLAKIQSEFDRDDQ